jgi:hypothetical protein
MKEYCKFYCPTCKEKCCSTHLFNPYEHFCDNGHTWGDE